MDGYIQYANDSYYWGSINPITEQPNGCGLLYDSSDKVIGGINIKWRNGCSKKIDVRYQKRRNGYFPISDKEGTHSGVFVNGMLDGLVVYEPTTIRTRDNAYTEVLYKYGTQYGRKKVIFHDIELGREMVMYIDDYDDCVIQSSENRNMIKNSKNESKYDQDKRGEYVICFSSVLATTFSDYVSSLVMTDTVRREFYSNGDVHISGVFSVVYVISGIVHM